MRYVVLTGQGTDQIRPVGPARLYHQAEPSSDRSDLDVHSYIYPVIRPIQPPLPLFFRAHTSLQGHIRFINPTFFKLSYCVFSIILWVSQQCRSSFVMLDYVRNAIPALNWKA